MSKTPAGYKSKNAIDFVALFVGTGGFVGYLPLIPGTFGSLVGLGLAAVFDPMRMGYLGAMVLVTVAGFFAAQRLEKVIGSKDPGCVVIDEISGMMITLWAIPPDVRYYVLGFIFFRLLDTFKPYPAYRLEREKGGVGVMMDDIVAGIYANLILQCLVRITS